MEGKRIVMFKLCLASLLRTDYRGPERSHILLGSSRRKAWSGMVAVGILRSEQTCVYFEGQPTGFACKFNVGILEKNESEDSKDK